MPRHVQLAVNDGPAASSAHGGIDISADSKLLAAGDAAIKKAEEDTGAHPASSAAVISRLAVKKPMKVRPVFAFTFLHIFRAQAQGSGTTLEHMWSGCYAEVAADSGTET